MAHGYLHCRDMSIALQLYLLRRRREGIYSHLLTLCPGIGSCAPDAIGDGSCLL